MENFYYVQYILSNMHTACDLLSDRCCHITRSCQRHIQICIPSSFIMYDVDVHPLIYNRLSHRAYLSWEEPASNRETNSCRLLIYTWWRHQTFSASLALYAGNSPVTGEYPTRRPVTRSFDVFFDLRLIKRSGKQSWGWWCEMPSRWLWGHRNDSRKH